MNIIDFFEEQPENKQTELLFALHQFISTYPGVNAVIHFTTPFYTRKRWMIYLSKRKDGSVEVCFVQARWFIHQKEALDFKKRKQVAGITFHFADQINYNLLHELITEALRVDETYTNTSRQTKHR